MNTLKGIFEDTKPKHRRNFIQENVKQLREMQGYWRNKEKSDAAVTKPVTNKYQNVPSRIAPRVSGSLPPKNAEQQPSKEQTMRASRSSSKTLGSSSSNLVSHVTQVGITRRSRSPSQRRNNLKKKEDTEELGLVDNASSRNSSPGSGSKTNRSLGCQTIDPRNTDDLYNEGVIRYPSSRKSPSPRKKQPTKRPPTREMGLQTERSLSPHLKNTAAAGDTSATRENNVPDLQKLSLSQNSSDEDEPSEVPEANYAKMNSRRAQSKTRSPNSLKPPSSYQKGVIPKYLRDRKEEWQKEAEQQVRDAPDPACPPGHVSLPDHERIETLKMLRKSYADLVQELNMMPVRTDTLRMRTRKMELEKQLNKIEHGIKVFSRPKVFVKIGA